MLTRLIIAISDRPPLSSLHDTAGLFFRVSRPAGLFRLRHCLSRLDAIRVLWFPETRDYLESRKGCRPGTHLPTTCGTYHSALGQVAAGDVQTEYKQVFTAATHGLPSRVSGLVDCDFGTVIEEDARIWRQYCHRGSSQGYTQRERLSTWAGRLHAVSARAAIISSLVVSRYNLRSWLLTVSMARLVNYIRGTSGPVRLLIAIVVL